MSRAILFVFGLLISLSASAYEGQQMTCRSDDGEFSFQLTEVGADAAGLKFRGVLAKRNEVIRNSIMRLNLMSRNLLKVVAEGRDGSAHQGFTTWAFEDSGTGKPRQFTLVAYSFALRKIVGLTTLFYCDKAVPKAWVN